MPIANPSFLGTVFLYVKCKCRGHVILAKSRCNDATMGVVTKNTQYWCSSLMNGTLLFSKNSNDSCLGVERELNK